MQLEANAGSSSCEKVSKTICLNLLLNSLILLKLVSSFDFIQISTKKLYLKVFHYFRGSGLLGGTMCVSISERKLIQPHLGTPRYLPHRNQVYRSSFR